MRSLLIALASGRSHLAAPELLAVGSLADFVFLAAPRWSPRSAQPPWTPSLSLAFRMFIFVRFTAAIYTGITDCDESADSLIVRVGCLPFRAS